MCPPKDMYCPECIRILAKKRPTEAELKQVKNPGGLYHFSGSMNRHRKNAHGVGQTKKGAVQK